MRLAPLVTLLLPALFFPSAPKTLFKVLPRPYKGIFPAPSHMIYDPIRFIPGYSKVSAAYIIKLVRNRRQSNRVL